jgi:hypothetical protein
MGEPDFRFEHPAIRADVPKLGRIILAERYRDLEAHAHYSLLPVRHKLFERKRGCSVEVHRESNHGIAKARNGSSPGFIFTSNLTAP